jgi:ketosteroid isomerase-like protein
MKSCFLILSLLISYSISAQQTQEQAVEEAIQEFFSSFHAQDAEALRNSVSPDIRMQTIGKTETGADTVLTASYDNFVESIVSIPDSVKFEERLMSISVRTDGPMAQAWTPYEFWINGKLSHCGVNSFQLFREGSSWKILYIIDTRRKEGCSQ